MLHLVGRRPGSPGCAYEELCDLRQVPALSGLYTLSYKSRRWGRRTSPQPVEWTFHRSCLEESCFYVTQFFSNHILASVMFLHLCGSHRRNVRAPGHPTHFWKCLGQGGDTSQVEKAGEGAMALETKGTVRAKAR